VIEVQAMVGFRTVPKDELMKNIIMTRLNASSEPIQNLKTFDNRPTEKQIGELAKAGEGCQISGKVSLQRIQSVISFGTAN
jgi:hypothetical protein